MKNSNCGKGLGFAGDFAEDVFEGDEADDFVAVVGDKEERQAGDAHAGEEVVDGEVGGDELGRAHVVGGGLAGGGVVGEQVEDVDDADEGLLGGIVDGQAVEFAE